MGHSEEAKAELGRLIVELMPKGRMRLNPKYVPEIACWLCMIGKRYERLREGTLTLPGARDNKMAQRTAAVMEQWLSCLQHALDQLSDKFSKHDWNDAWIQIDREFGINNGPLAYPHYDGYGEGPQAETGD